MRSIRLDPAHDELLRTDAEKRGISVNSLISEIFTRYSEWDRFADKFGMITFSRQGFRKMFDLLDEDKVVQYAKEVGSRTAPEIALFWFKKLNTQTFLKFVALYSKYSKTYECEIEMQGAGKQYLITLHHEINEKYSIFLKNYFESAIRNFVGVAPQCKVGQTSVAINFSEPLP